MLPLASLVPEHGPPCLFILLKGLLSMAASAVLVFGYRRCTMAYPRGGQQHSQSTNLITRPKHHDAEIYDEPSYICLLHGSACPYEIHPVVPTFTPSLWHLVAVSDMLDITYTGRNAVVITS